MAQSQVTARVIAAKATEFVKPSAGAKDYARSLMIVAPRYPRPSARARPRPSNTRHALLAIMGVLAVFAVAFLIMNPKSPFRAPHLAESEADAELYTGTIQLAPSRSNLCRQLTFDNRTGMLHDKGSANCDKPIFAANGAEPERYWRNNIERVREGFIHR